MNFNSNQYKIAKFFAIAEDWGAGTIEGQPKKTADDKADQRGGTTRGAQKEEPLTLRMHLSRMDADIRARFLAK